MGLEVASVTRDYDIFAACGFDNVDHVGHAYYSRVLIEYGMVLQFEVLSFPQCFVDWISLEHEG